MCRLVRNTFVSLHGLTLAPGAADEDRHGPPIPTHAGHAGERPEAHRDDLFVVLVGPGGSRASSATDERSRPRAAAMSSAWGVGL
jgi:hypothetical protein